MRKKRLKNVFFREENVPHEITFLCDPKLADYFIGSMGKRDERRIERKSSK